MGAERYAEGSLPTEYGFTGQYAQAAEFGLLWFRARWYDPGPGRGAVFDRAQPDTVVPVANQGVQAWDRYAYVNNNPVRYTDPSGHCIFGIDTVVCLVLAGAAVGAATGYLAQVWNNRQNGSLDIWTENISAEPIIGGAILGAGVVIAAPVVVTAAGDMLVGAGLATGSTALFTDGMSTYQTAATIEHFYKYGTTPPSWSLILNNSPI